MRDNRRMKQLEREMDLLDHIKEAPRQKPDAGISHLVIVIECLCQSQLQLVRRPSLGGL
jgi:hypothetical protein